MAMLVNLLEQQLERQPRTHVTQPTARWDAVLAHVYVQECGLGVNLPVNVCCYSCVQQDHTSM